MGTQLLSPKRRRSPQFWAHVYYIHFIIYITASAAPWAVCGQTAGWIKMPLGMELGVGPGDCMFDGDPAPIIIKGIAPNFCPCLLWPNTWMDQDVTWYGGKPQPCRRRCVRWGRSSPKTLKGAQAPVFGSCLLWPNSSMDEDATWYGSRSRRRPHCVRRRPSSPAKGAQQPPLFSAHVYCGHGRPSHLLLSSCTVLGVA